MRWEDIIPLPQDQNSKGLNEIPTEDMKYLLSSLWSAFVVCIVYYHFMREYIITIYVDDVISAICPEWHQRDVGA